MLGTIYALCDPRTEEVRYIGQTMRAVEKYVTGHWKAARNGSDRYVHRWIRSLGREPVHFILEECDTREELNEAERFWIDWYRRCGFARLTNLTDGGDGGDTSAGFTKETKRKMSEGQKNKDLSKQSESFKRSSALKAHHDRLRGIPRTQEARDKISTTLRGKKHTSTHRKRNKEAHAGQVPWNKKVVV